MKKPRTNKVASPKPPHWYRQKNSRGRWDVFDGKDKLVRADLTRREAAVSARKPRVFETAHDAARSIRRKWQEWRAAGVRFSKFHKPGTAFALPFDPDDYLWAGPVTLKLDIPEGGDVFCRKGHYRRGVRKYLGQLKRRERVPPVVLLYHEAWDWTMQDGNHRLHRMRNNRC